LVLLLVPLEIIVISSVALTFIQQKNSSQLQ
jgi:hypothetical protein